MELDRWRRVASASRRSSGMDALLRLWFSKHCLAAFCRPQAISSALPLVARWSCSVTEQQLVQGKLPRSKTSLSRAMCRIFTAQALRRARFSWLSKVIRWRWSDIAIAIFPQTARAPPTDSSGRHGRRLVRNSEEISNGRPWFQTDGDMVEATPRPGSRESRDWQLQFIHWRKTTKADEGLLTGFLFGCGTDRYVAHGSCS